MRYVHRSFILLIACFGVLSASNGLAVDYAVERIASGLAQPDYVAQAPGDPPGVIYYSTRCMSTDVGGFGNTNHMGSIWRYDINTRAPPTEIMNLNYRTFSGDEGLVGFAFSPDFNTPGAPGYQKLYVSSSQAGATATERVEEYVCNGPNGTVPPDPANMNHAKINSTVLQYNNIKTDPNHTIDWIGFDPTASSHAVGTADRNYLYISCGDGDIGGEAQNRPEQKANMVLGKLLRVDVDVTNHGDAYPGTSNGNNLKNFAIPPSNPIPLWNAAHPAQKLVGTHLDYTGTFDNNNQNTLPMSADYGTAASPAALPEIYFTGTRNQFRMSIDRQTGDFWMGDVGENTREEVNFLKAGTYNPNGTQLPIDFGYASREGTLPTQGPTASGFANAVKNSSGATTLQWNLSDGSTMLVNSTNPVQEGSHTAGRSSYIGGYVYRGPIASLQGKYFWSDYVTGNVFQLDNFDRNTPLANYSGTNFNQVNGLASIGTRGTVLSANTSSLWQSLIFDRTDPTYTAAQQSSNLQFGVGRAVSFGEDNEGNVYIIDFGGNRGDVSFGNDYPSPGKGEIFKLVPVGDFDGDGLLTVADVSALSAALADLDAYKSESGIAANNNAALVKLGDINGDGAVTDGDVQSLVVYLANHGGGAGSLTAVPEPASYWLLGIGGVLLLIFARNRPGRQIGSLA